MNKYQNCRILLFRGKGVISQLIRWQTRSPYSHAAVLLEDGRTLVEAWQGKGVQLRQLTPGEENIDYFLPEEISPEQWKAAITFLLKQLDKNYDYLSVLRFISRRKKDAPDKWFCSELVFQAFQEAGISLLARIPAWAVSPGMLSYSPKLVKVEKED